jgi:hypothetical protein
METESSLWNIVFIYKNRMMDYVQKHNICINVPPSKTFSMLMLENACGISKQSLHSYDKMSDIQLCSSWLVKDIIS